MDFEILYYRDSLGHSSVEKFLLDLGLTNERLFNQAAKGLEKLRNRAYHKEPLSKYVESGLWELRIRAGKDILRILYTFTKGQKIFLLHIFIKKQQKTQAKELEMARKRSKELKEKEII